MRIVFFGSDDFAATSLNGILQSSHQVVACVTQPDTRQGRGMKMSLSPIKEMALEQGILCLQPISLKEEALVAYLKAFEADLLLVVAYGKILTQTILDIPKIFCINVHGSLLPKYRGAAPINWAIINGEKETGVTVQKMVLKLDEGDIIAQEKILLSGQETSHQLRLNMAQVGANLLVKTLDQIAAGRHTCSKQDEAQASYAAKLTKDLGSIDWKLPAERIERLVRGLKPWPGTFITYKGKVLKILEASVVKIQGVPGTVIDISKQGFTVGCGQDSLLVKQVHLEAAKPTSAYDFLQGYRLTLQERLL